jgi:hypothetical protein
MLLQQPPSNGTGDLLHEHMKAPQNNLEGLSVSCSAVKWTCSERSLACRLLGMARITRYLEQPRQESFDTGKKHQPHHHADSIEGHDDHVATRTSQVSVHPLHLLDT